MEEGKARKLDVEAEATPLLKNTYNIMSRKSTVYGPKSSVRFSLRSSFVDNMDLDLLELELESGEEYVPCPIPGWDAYNRSLDEHPLIAKACTSLVGWTISALLEQLILPSGIKQVVAMAAFGFFYHGPSGHFFYHWLDEKIPGKDPISVCTKIAIDQTLWCPLFMTVFFVYLGIVHGDSVSAIGQTIRTDLWSGVQTSWKFWPLMHFVSFRYVKNKHRLLYLNTAEVFFSIMLLLIATKND